MSTHDYKGSHAVVIGGSINGMAVGAVLARRFERVTLLDRDRLTEEPTTRRRAPQGHHPNLLQMGGRRQLDALFPGLLQDLQRHGAFEFDMGSQVARFSGFGWALTSPLQRSLMACTRPLLEARMRHALRRQHHNVRVVDEIGVTGYRFAGEGDRLRVVGVDTDRRGSDLEHLDADLVVDCGGRGSKAFRWLAQVGRPEPREKRVDAHSNYATRYFRPPTEAQGYWWRAMAVEAKAPDFPRGAVLLPTEDGRWLVTAIGINQDYAPTEADAWMQWVRELRAPAMGQVLERATPLTDVVQSRSMVNYWKQMHQYPHLPQGLLLFGDVIAAFNPSYGQGVTSGVLAARLLDSLLARHNGPVDQRLVRRFYKAQARLLGEGWRYSTGMDFRWPGTEGERPATLALDKWGSALLEEASAFDPWVMRHLLPLLDFGASYWSLAHPELVARVGLHLLKRTVSGPMHLPTSTQFDPRASAPERSVALAA